MLIPNQSFVMKFASHDPPEKPASTVVPRAVLKLHWYISQVETAKQTFCDTPLGQDG
jgi:hypothetical protein